MLLDYTVIDLEMTGLSPKRDSVLEVGAARIRNGKIQKTYTSLVYTALPIPEKIIELTGITKEMTDSGRNCDEVMTELLLFIGEDTLVGHNVIYDYGFIKQWAINHNQALACMAVDTLKLAQKFLPKTQKKNLESLCAYFEIPRANAHRALEDAVETHLLFEQIKELFSSAKDAETVFMPKPLPYKAKKQVPATGHQINYLKQYARHFGLPIPKNLYSFTKSDASRQLDFWISHHGHLPEKKPDVFSEYNSRLPGK